MTTLEGFQVALRCDGVDDGLLRPLSFRVTERVSAPYTIEVSAAMTDAVDVPALLRKGVEVLVHGVDGKLVRRFEGVATSVTERFHRGDAVLVLSASSPLSILEFSSDYRIFQALTAPDIVKQVLASCGVTKVDARLSGTYATRDSCTQYCETMAAFVSRLMEEEGITYFFEAKSDGLTLVLTDSASGFAAIEGDVTFSPDKGMRGQSVVSRVTDLSALRPGKVTLRDLAWQTPALDLSASVTDTAAGSTKSEHYEYPGGYVTAAEGKRRAQNLVDAAAAHTTGARMTSTVPLMSAGHAFTLKGSDAHNLEWVTTEVQHEWTEQHGVSTYGNTLRAIKKSAPFRPERRTPRPVVPGPHTAIVTGPSGQEIHTDAHGRVKLKFPWDRRAKFDEQSSAWVRVAEIPLTGSMHVPRIGWEVLVEFEHGDPDRPVVVGRLFNATYVPPYALPANKTRSVLGSYSSPGGTGHNEIRMEDAAGSEHIHVHAQHDYTLTTAGNRTATVTTSTSTTVKVDQSVHVKKNQSEDVKGKRDLAVSGRQSLTVDKDREKTVKGDERVTVVGDASLAVKGAHDITVGAKSTLQAGGDTTIEISGNLDEQADDAIRVSLGDDLEISVGAAKSEIAKKGKSLTIGGAMTETVGGAMSVTSEKDLAIRVGGKKTSTTGAAWSATSGADIELSSSDALELTAGATLTLTGAATITLKVGGSKVTIGQGGVTIDAAKVKLTSDGPLSELGAVVLSK